MKIITSNPILIALGLINAVYALIGINQQGISYISCLHIAAALFIFWVLYYTREKY
jgi:hypothetical protein